MFAHVIRRALFVAGMLLLAYYVYPRMGGFTEGLALTEGKLFGFFPLMWLDNQWVHGALLLFCALWLYRYLEGFSEELAIARYRSLSQVISCAARWLIAMVLWLILVLLEPVLMFQALTTWTTLPLWLVWVIVVVFFFLATGLGLRYPAYIVASVREQIIRERL
ncbi:hypothetical protein IQ265_03980 [Nodosilinea sp. LEGE 06152]|uniref:hypothetical protein n=1 Tax=Nodosilinea sp. LEGE 06152 TaxID=2777966 RepID=UPI00187FE061|nr:hypothetical protein [Nodosilinea sp. LEGE 06152]MBE9155994.1 hypothetical protein [Nodosilinea sp. LEGE 06152]